MLLLLLLLLLRVMLRWTLMMLRDVDGDVVDAGATIILTAFILTTIIHTIINTTKLFIYART